MSRDANEPRANALLDRLHQSRDLDREATRELYAAYGCELLD